MVDGEEVRARPEDCHSLGRRWRGSLRSAVAGQSAVISGDEGERGILRENKKERETDTLS